MGNPLSAVASWLYMLGDVGPPEASRIAASDAGLVVIDAADFSEDTPRPYTESDLNAMRGGTDRLVVSYLSIGEAEEYRPYWDSGWADNPPAFLSAANPEWPDNHTVKYWDPAWQKIVLDQVDDIVRAGFNGLYLDIVDAFEFWEEADPGSGINYRQEMAEFVAGIDARATATLDSIGDEARDFVLIGQNGESLIANPTYRAHIDGLAKEDLQFTYLNDTESGFRPVPQDEFREAAGYLKAAEQAGIEVFLVEYLTPARQVQFAQTLAAERAFARAMESPLYIAQDRDLAQIYDQPWRAAPVPQEGRPPSRDGSPGPDRLTGTDHNDTLFGGGGADLIDGRQGDDRIAGNGGRDVLLGGPGDDVIRGDAGGDRLTGGAGDDWLSGGAGSDTFAFGPGDGHDTVADFKAGSDRILVTDGAQSPSDLAIASRDSAVEVAGAEWSVTLLNADPHLLTAGDFLFQ